MTNATSIGPKPPIVLSEEDYDRLTGLAEAVEDRAPAIAEELQNEIDRAKVVPLGAVPADVVRMGSIVEYRAESGPAKRVTLVFPGDADIADGKISILTPIGTALIGLAKGQSIAWTARDGRQHQLTVLNVEQPPAPPAAEE
ncbi:nucleoside diphosphate kinase regulator [Pedomonas mirosovicensis]|uniref:nucleoside diphosphate kinase regulator n=1 Tax=Pedomonas mirosovicensis TaxID=2908641 RepID=UPI00216AA550|nr:nucleoside diphosphate kinase regulator [Pedomonas mirosovicensis]MCH8686587.1 nucleoside diphosphate kinase regulator [Pedomonas mirosovicensis]